MTAPDFRHAPMKGSWSLLAYGGRAMGEDLEPIEFNLQRPSDPTSIVNRAKFEAGWNFRTHVKVRDQQGAIIFDGPVT